MHFFSWPAQVVAEEMETGEGPIGPLATADCTGKKPADAWAVREAQRLGNRPQKDSACTLNFVLSSLNMSAEVTSWDLIASGPQRKHPTCSPACLVFTSPKIRFQFGRPKNVCPDNDLTNRESLTSEYLHSPVANKLNSKAFLPGPLRDCSRRSSNQ